MPPKMALTHEAHLQPTPGRTQVSDPRTCGARYESALAFHDKSGDERAQGVAEIQRDDVDPHLRPPFVQEEQVLAIMSSLCRVLRGWTLTLTTSAPRASVQDPINAPMILLARRLLKLGEVADQISQTNKPSEPVRKTGLRPKYSAHGTQKKFCRFSISPSCSRRGGGILVVLYSRRDRR